MNADVCRCGRVARVHPLRDCYTFRSTTDPDGATERARMRGVERDRLIRAARNALTAHTYDAALGAVLALLQLDRKETP